jgi:hypothetical protein
MSEVYNNEGDSQDRESIQVPLRLWRHAFGGERGLLHVFTGVRQGRELTDIQTANFNYPPAAEAAARWALEKSRQGQEVYHCGHLLAGPARIKENAASVRTLYAEIDGGEPPTGRTSPPRSSRARPASTTPTGAWRTPSRRRPPRG